MKLQLNETTLNAYINEAIKQEINEAGLLSGIGKVAGEAGKGIAKGAKGVAKGSKNYVKALTGNRGVVKNVANEMDNILRNPEYQNLFREFGFDSVDQLPKNVRKNPKKLLQFVKDMQKKNTAVHDAWKANRNMVFNKDLGAQGNSLVNLERDLTKAINGTKLARIGTAAAAGGLGAGYLLGRNGKSGQKDPDAPWNPPVDGNGDNGGNGDGWDGAFPWDDVQPRWTPKPKKKQPQPNPVIPKKPSIMDTPLEKVDTSKMNLPTGVTQLNAPGLDINRPMPQPTIAQSAIHTMAQTTNANDNRPLQGRADLNRRTAANAKDIINQNVQNGNMSRQDARAQKQQINQARRSLNRTGQPINN